VAPGRAVQFAIRLATVADVPELRKFRCLSYGEDYTADVERLIRGDLCDALEDGLAESCVHVAVLETVRGELVIVGVVTHGPAEDSTDEPGPTDAILALAVLPEWQRRGIGIALKRAVIDECIQRGLVRVTSEVHRRN
jgi:GNAT superfamily N-acetyltransferase